MKAVQFKQFGGPDELFIGDWPDPQPGSTDLLVQVRATALNRADLLQREGKYPPPAGESTILGLEMAGTVIACGSDVLDFSVGDRICGLLPGGGYAEKAVIPAAQAIPLPDGMSFEEAAAVPEVFLTAFQALDWLAQLQEKERVLIHAGASGVGTAAIQLARRMGASEVFVTASAAKHELCRQLGADHCIDYRQENYSTVVLEKTSTQGVDILIDFVGGPNFSPNLHSMNLDGRIVMLAFLGGPKTPEAVNLATILRKRIHVMGSTLRSRSKAYKAKLTKDFVDKHWTAFENKELKPVIDSVHDWADVAHAHTYMAENRNQGKIILSIP